MNETDALSPKRRQAKRSEKLPFSEEQPASWELTFELDSAKVMLLGHSTAHDFGAFNYPPRRNVEMLAEDPRYFRDDRSGSIRSRRPQRS